MKTKLFKRIGSLTLAFVMAFALSATAFAAEPDEQSTSDEVIAVAAGEDGISVLADQAVTGSAPAWGTATLWPHLSSYLGVTKKIRITTQSSGGGAVDIELFKGNTLKSDGNWIMGTNDTGEWTLTLPSSGDYKLLVHNKSGSTVYITAQWL